MTLRLPSKADRDTQIAFQEIEDRLWKLEQAVKKQPDNSEVIDELRDEINQKLLKPTHLDFRDVFRGAGAHALGYVPDPGYESSGMTKVLRSDGTWGQGVVQEVPWRTGGSYAGTSSAQRVVNVSGSMSVLGALSACTLRARRSQIKTATCRVHNSSNITVNTGAATLLTFDTVDWDTAGIRSTTSRLAAPSDLPGYYFAFGSARFAGNNPASGSYHQIRIEKGSAGTGTAANIVGLVTASDVPVVDIPLDLQVHCTVYLAAGEYVEMFALTGHNDTIENVNFYYDGPGFGMTYLGT